MGGDLPLYIRQGIPAKSLQNINITCDNESLFGEVNLYKKKWLIGGTYNPNKSLISSHIDRRGKDSTTHGKKIWWKQHILAGIKFGG